MASNQEKIMDITLKDLLDNKGLREAIEKDFYDSCVVFSTKHTDKWIEDYKKKNGK